VVTHRGSFYVSISFFFFCNLRGRHAHCFSIDGLIITNNELATLYKKTVVACFESLKLSSPGGTERTMKILEQSVSVSVSVSVYVSVSRPRVGLYVYEV
jgi:hypothetical protein